MSHFSSKNQVLYHISSQSLPERISPGQTLESGLDFRDSKQSPAPANSAIDKITEANIEKSLKDLESNLTRKQKDTADIAHRFLICDFFKQFNKSHRVAIDFMRMECKLVDSESRFDLPIASAISHLTKVQTRFLGFTDASPPEFWWLLLDDQNQFLSTLNFSVHHSFVKLGYSNLRCMLATSDSDTAVEEGAR